MTSQLVGNELSIVGITSALSKMATNMEGDTTLSLAEFECDIRSKSFFREIQGI